MFVHSVKVPKLYKISAQVAKQVKEDGRSLKQVVYQQNHPNLKGIYALVAETLHNLSQIDELISETKILEKETRLDAWLARILINELIWGKKTLGSNCKPVQTVLRYHDEFLKCLPNIQTIKKNKTKKVRKPRYVRVNTLKMTVEEAVSGLQNEGWSLIRFDERKNYAEFLATVSTMTNEQFMADMHVKDLLVFPPKTEFYYHCAYKRGELILQDKSSCLSPYLLNPDVGSTVLDMCAAPGMKTSQLAAMVGPTGQVYAVEVDKRRYEVLLNFMKQTGSENVKTVKTDAIEVNETDFPDVEYILVDPSCSGSGIVDRFEIDENEMIDYHRLEKLAGFQIIILRHALNNFSKVKRVVYSTCSIYPDENEEVVKKLIGETPNFKLVDVKSIMKDRWYNFGSSEFVGTGDRCLYAKPERDLCNGFFVAVFERLAEGETNEFYIEETRKPEVLRFKVSVQKPTCVRVNTLLMTFEEAVQSFEEEGWCLKTYNQKKDYPTFLFNTSSISNKEFMVDMHIKELLLFPPNTDFFEYPRRDIIVQEKSSCLAPYLLNPEVGSTVLDMCAGPGIKTSQLSAMVGYTGRVYAVEKSLEKISPFHHFMRRIGAKNVKIINCRAQEINETDYPNVEYILVDPNCSSYKIRKYRENNVKDQYRLLKFVDAQVTLLRHALKNFSTAKRVVYTTCSLNPKENEEVVQKSLAETKSFKLVDIKNMMGQSWYNFGSPEFEGIGEKCLYARPKRDLCNAIFIALFERLAEGETNEFYIERKRNLSENLDGKENPVRINRKKKKAEEINQAEQYQEIKETDREEKYKVENMSSENKKSKSKKKTNKDTEVSSNLTADSVNVNTENDEPISKKTEKSKIKLEIDSQNYSTEKKTKKQIKTDDNETDTETKCESEVKLEFDDNNPVILTKNKSKKNKKVKDSQ